METAISDAVGRLRDAAPSVEDAVNKLRDATPSVDEAMSKLRDVAPSVDISAGKEALVKTASRSGRIVLVVGAIGAALAAVAWWLRR